VKPIGRTRGGKPHVRAAEDRRELVRDIGESLRHSDQAPEPVPDPCPSCGVAGRMEIISFRWGGERHITSVCHACGRTWTEAHD
jgi:hypothetical protein